MTGKTWAGKITDASGLEICTMRYTILSGLQITSSFDGYGRLTTGQTLTILITTPVSVDIRKLPKTHFATLEAGERYTIEDARFRPQTGIGQKKSQLILYLS